MGRIPAIGPLRAVAALLVLLSHVAFWTGAANVDGAGRLVARGDSGVAVFFAISAFLLTRGYCAGRATPPDYARRRFARIMPAYWLALAAVLGAAVMIDGTVGSLRQVLTHVFLLQGFTHESYRAFTQTWSLTTEVTFYVLVPAIGAWLLRRRAAGHTVPVVLVLVATFGILVQAFASSQDSPTWGWLGTSALGHAAWFCVGIGWAWMLEQRPGIASRLTAGHAVLVAVLAYLLAATPLGGPIGLETPTVLAAAAKEILYGIVAGALLVAATNAPREVQRRSSTGLALASGETSYGVFLWHLVVLQVLFASLGLRIFHAPFVLVLTVTLVVTWFLADASRRFVERPAIRWGHRGAPRRTR